MANLGLRGGGNHGIWEMPLVRIIKQSSYIYIICIYLLVLLLLLLYY